MGNDPFSCFNFNGFTPSTILTSNPEDSSSRCRRCARRALTLRQFRARLHFMKFDIPPNPIAITLLRSDRIMPQAHHLAHLLQQFEFGIGNNQLDLHRSAHSSQCSLSAFGGWRSYKLTFPPLPHTLSRWWPPLLQFHVSPPLSA